MEPNPTLREWVSSQALRLHLGSFAGRTLLIGADAEAPNCFCSTSIQAAREPIEIGLICSRHGIDPEFVLIPYAPRLLIGYSCSITCIDVSRVEMIATHTLDGVFYQFLRLDDTSDLLAVHELGVVRVNVDGLARWSVATDDILAEALIDTAGRLVIKLWRHAGSVVVDLESGAVISNDSKEEG